MREWHSEALRKLDRATFPAPDREEIARELAAYLEDLYTDERSGGMDESAAAQCALSELHEDARLGVNLRRARKESTVNDRTKRFWLPGMVTLLASAGRLAIFQIAGVQADFEPLWLHGGAAAPHSVYLPLAIHWQWLCVLPFLGAVGAYWSRQAGSGPALRIAVGIFPALVFLTTFLVWVPLSAAIGALPPVRIFLPAFAGHILSWVVIPGVALLLGVMPFLRNSNARQRIA